MCWDALLGVARVQLRGSVERSRDQGSLCTQLSLGRAPLLVLMVYGPVGCEVDECSFPERKWDSVGQFGLLREHFQGAKPTIAISSSTSAARSGSVLAPKRLLSVPSSVAGWHAPRF